MSCRDCEHWDKLTPYDTIAWCNWHDENRQEDDWCDNYIPLSESSSSCTKRNDRIKVKELKCEKCGTEFDTSVMVNEESHVVDDDIYVGSVLVRKAQRDKTVPACPNCWTPIYYSAPEKLLASKG